MVRRLFAGEFSYVSDFAAVFKIIVGTLSIVVFKQEQKQDEALQVFLVGFGASARAEAEGNS